MKGLFTAISISLLVGLTLVSCNKNKGNFQLGGTIMDDSFNQSLVGATVTLYQVPVGSSSQNLVASTTTDANGKYHFTFKREKMEKYVLKITKDLYFEQIIEIPFSEFSLKEEKVVNGSTTAKSWVRISLINVDPLSTDLLEYTKQQGKVGCSECCDPATVSYQGSLDTSFYCINDGNSTYSFLYSASSIGSGIKSITSTPFDTVDLTLSY